MTFTTRTSITTIALGATLMVGTLAPSLVFAGDKVTVYFTRHAEKQALLIDAGEYGEDEESNGHLVQPNGAKGAEELSDLGQKRAAELADWFFSKGITSDLTHIFSSQKLRTRQTIVAIAADALSINGDDLVTSDDNDYSPGDGIQQFPNVADVEDEDTIAVDYVDDDGVSRLETLDSPSSSVDLTVDALMNLSDDSVALVAMHSGTFYKILTGLGIDTPDDVTDEGLFPKDSKGKISTFGDIWMVEIEDNEAEVIWRKNLQFQKFKVDAEYTD